VCAGSCFCCVCVAHNKPMMPLDEIVSRLPLTNKRNITFVLKYCASAADPTRWAEKWGSAVEAAHTHSIDLPTSLTYSRPFPLKLDTRRSFFLQLHPWQFEHNNEEKIECIVAAAKVSIPFPVSVFAESICYHLCKLTTPTQIASYESVILELLAEIELQLGKQKPQFWLQFAQACIPAAVNLRARLLKLMRTDHFVTLFVLTLACTQDTFNVITLYEHNLCNAEQVGAACRCLPRALLEKLKMTLDFHSSHRRSTSLCGECIRRRSLPSRQKRIKCSCEDIEDDDPLISRMSQVVGEVLRDLQSV
jgi:hypothetical protein